MHAHTRRAFLIKYLCGPGYPTKIKELPVKEKNNYNPNQSITQLSVFLQLSSATQVSASPQLKFTSP